ncbi:hypothetical protein B0H10DRAFT_1947006 [Mycena sp. CBHHK59/15]|nr:hypothetical protein B0H10DRAFT_1947006 [Mycena sp. CBHHK59/15]
MAGATTWRGSTSVRIRVWHASEKQQERGENRWPEDGGGRREDETPHQLASECPLMDRFPHSHHKRRVRHTIGWEQDIFLMHFQEAREYGGNTDIQPVTSWYLDWNIQLETSRPPSGTRNHHRAGIMRAWGRPSGVPKNVWFHRLLTL